MNIKQIESIETFLKECKVNDAGGKAIQIAKLVDDLSEPVFYPIENPIYPTYTPPPPYTINFYQSSTSADDTFLNSGEK